MGAILWLLFSKTLFHHYCLNQRYLHLSPFGAHTCGYVLVFHCFKTSLIFHLFPPASETCNDFHPMFFTHDRSFEEFFCICIQLLNKTWKEMRATSEDFNKVMWISDRGRGFPQR